MSENFFKELPYSEEEARQESERLSNKIKSKEAVNYAEANEQVDKEQDEEFYEEWNKNPEGIYEKKSQILDELVDGIENDLTEQSVFDFTDPRFWPALAESDRKQSEILAKKYNMRTDEFGSLGSARDIARAVGGMTGKDGFARRLFYRAFFQSELKAGVLEQKDRATFLAAFADGPKNDEFLRNKFGYSLLQRKLDALESLAKKENYKDIANLLESMLKTFITLYQSVQTRDSNETEKGKFYEQLGSCLGKGSAEAKSLSAALIAFFDDRRSIILSHARGRKIGEEFHEYMPHDSLGHQFGEISYRSLEANRFDQIFKKDQDLIATAIENVKKTMTLLKDNGMAERTNIF